MSSITPFTCLFCQHINPAGAVFCNSCAAQLNLQPCLHCDAVDDRMATHCYKCGTPFPLLQIPEPDAAAVPGAQDMAQTSSALGHAIFTPAQEVLLRRDLTPAPMVVERLHEKTEPDITTAAAVYRSGWLMSGTVFLLVLLAVSVYLYWHQPGKNILTPDTKPLVQMAPTVTTLATPAKPDTPEASADAPQVNVVTTPTDPPRKTTFGANAAGEVSPEVTPSAGSPPSIHSSPMTEPEAVTRRVPPIGIECVPAVATLGLCSPETGQEKP